MPTAAVLLPALKLPSTVTAPPVCLKAPAPALMVRWLVGVPTSTVPPMSRFCPTDSVPPFIA